MRVERWRRQLRRRPGAALAALVVVATTLYVVAMPFARARYPMMTDLPFHAANASVMRHHLDEAWHFREQFVLQPFAVPYLTLYLVAAAAMSFTSAVTAIKIAAVVMLLLLPAGLAVLAWGMHKSPLLGVLGVGLAWGGLTHWGFLNFVGALGLFAMALGVAMRQLATPSAGRGALLCGLLVAIFFTHPFRFPFAMAAVATAAACLYPTTGRWRPVALPMLPPLGLFGLWWANRSNAIETEIGPLELDLERLSLIDRYLYGGLLDPREAMLTERALAWLAVVAAVLALCALGRRPARGRAHQIGSHAVVAASAFAFLGLYLMLPMQIGIWWYVFPREITSAVYISLALVPDLPRSGAARLAFATIAAVALVPLGSLVGEHYARFDLETRDFAAITERIPHAPRLMYLVLDHHGATAKSSPFIHLPAYVQAEKGGWLSFHFAAWGASPVVYRDRAEPGAVVPPPVPLRWEWTPQRFEVLRHGAFFDWFLVRSGRSPAFRLAADPALELVAHEGDWWLYQRR